MGVVGWVLFEAAHSGLFSFLGYTQKNKMINKMFQTWNKCTTYQFIVQLDFLTDRFQCASHIHLGQLVCPLTHFLQLRLVLGHLYQGWNNAKKIVMKNFCKKQFSNIIHLQFSSWIIYVLFKFIDLQIQMLHFVIFVKLFLQTSSSFKPVDTSKSHLSSLSE